MQVGEVVVAKAVFDDGRRDTAQPVASLLLLQLVGHLHRRVEQARRSGEGLDEGTLCEPDVCLPKVELILYCEVIVSQSIGEGETGRESLSLCLDLVQLQACLMQFVMARRCLLMLCSTSLVDLGCKSLNRCFFLIKLVDIRAASVLAMTLFSSELIGLLLQLVPAFLHLRLE